MAGTMKGFALLVVVYALCGVSVADPDEDSTPEYFEYDLTLMEQPRGLGVQLDDSLVITAFAPSSIVQESGETQIGDKILSIGGEELTGTARIRELLKESEYPLVIRFRATVTAERTCVAPPKGGRIEISFTSGGRSPEYFDYLAADFTTGDILFDDSAELVMADPPQACYDKINNAEEVAGKTVVVNRGRCSFMKKIEYLERLGAKGVIVTNDGSGLLHIPKPPLGGQRRALPAIPAVMITSQAGQDLRKIIVNSAPRDDGDEEGASGSVVMNFQPDAEVAKLWKEISPLLVSSSAWPEELSDRKRKYRKLSQVHHPDKPKGSKDRFAAIAEAYKKANYDLNPEVQAEYKGIDDYMANA